MKWWGRLGTFSVGKSHFSLSRNFLFSSTRHASDCVGEDRQRITCLLGSLHRYYHLCVADLYNRQPVYPDYQR